MKNRKSLLWKELNSEFGSLMSNPFYRGNKRHLLLRIETKFNSLATEGTNLEEDFLADLEVRFRHSLNSN